MDEPDELTGRKLFTGPDFAVQKFEHLPVKHLEYKRYNFLSEKDFKLQYKNTVSGLTVMLVDDESFVRKVNSRVFHRLTNTRVLEADSAGQALTIMKKKPVDIMVTDIQMPKMNGLELVKEIRCGRAGCPRDLPVMVITTFSNTEVLKTSISLDVNGFLVKPISPQIAENKLLSALGEQLELRPGSEYDQINTALDSLGKPVAREGVNAAIIRQSNEKGPSRPLRPQTVPLAGLRVGMTLADNIHSKDGMVMMSTGHLLTELHINRLRDLKGLLQKHTFLVFPPLDEG